MAPYGKRAEDEMAKSPWIALLAAVFIWGLWGMLAQKPLHTAPGQVTVNQWMTYHPAQSLMTLTVIAGYPHGGNNLNGTTNGTLIVRVPVHIKVFVYFSNHDYRPHSLALVADGTVSPNSGVPRDRLLIGLASGKQAWFAFFLRHLGRYRLTSLVPGDLQHGLWITVEGVSRGIPQICYQSH